MTLLCPRLVLDLFKGTQNGLDADTVCAVGVGKVAGSVNLVRFDFTHKCLYNLDIVVAQLSLLYTAGLIEREVEEMGIRAVIETY